jgi:hypothetical protein
VNATFMKIEFYLVNCTLQAWGQPCSPTPIGPVNTIYVPAKRAASPPVVIPSGSKAYVSDVVSLAGVTAVSFGASQATQFRTVMAAQLGNGVAATDITITSVTADIAAVGRRSRSLLTAGVNVAFTVATSSSATAAAVSSAITSTTSNSAAFTSALQAGGLTAVSGVALSTAPTTTVSAAAPPSAPGLAPVGSAASHGAPRAVATASILLALLAALGSML